MSKNKNNTQEAEIVEEMPLANPQGKTVEELKEVAMTLQGQVNQLQTQAVKAQGALEVILQMIPKEGVKEIVAEEASQKENHQMNGQKMS